MIIDKTLSILKNLEESLWTPQTRFDNDYMEKILD